MMDDHETLKNKYIDEKTLGLSPNINTNRNCKRFIL